MIPPSQNLWMEASNDLEGKDVGCPGNGSFPVLLLNPFNGFHGAGETQAMTLVEGSQTSTNLAIRALDGSGHSCALVAAACAAG